MLVLSRKVNESIQIGDNITITIVRTKEGVTRLGIDAPREMNIVRSELIVTEDVVEQPEPVNNAA